MWISCAFADYKELGKQTQIYPIEKSVDPDQLVSDRIHIFNSD